VSSQADGIRNSYSAGSGDWPALRPEKRGISSVPCLSDQRKQTLVWSKHRNSPTRGGEKELKAQSEKGEGKTNGIGSTAYHDRSANSRKGHLRIWGARGGGGKRTDVHTTPKRWPTAAKKGEPPLGVGVGSRYSGHHKGVMIWR